MSPDEEEVTSPDEDVAGSDSVERLSDPQMKKLTKKVLMVHIRKLQKALQEGGALTVRPPETELPLLDGILHVRQFDNAELDLASLADVAGFLMNNKMVKSADMK